MTVIRLKTQVPEDRRLTLALPADFPVGEAEVEVTARPVGEPVREFEVVLPPDDRPRAFPVRPAHPKLAAEHDAFERMLPELMTRYACRYVAIHDGAVIAVGDSEVEALTAAHAARPGALVLVRRVTDQPQPIGRIPSFRPVEAR